MDDYGLRFQQLQQAVEISRALNVPLPSDGIFSVGDLPTLWEAIDRKKEQDRLRRGRDFHWNARRLRKGLDTRPRARHPDMQND